MATVFDYIILTSTRHDYRSSGTSHADAMQRFVADPPIIYGFHEGNYDCTHDEEFIVIGPTQEQPTSNVIKRLVAQRRVTFVFRTPEQIAAENEMREKLREWLPRQAEDSLVVIEAADGNVPPHNKTAAASDIGAADHRGLWINDKRIPWSAITGYSLADSS